MRRPATPIPPVDPTRREARWMAGAFLASLALMTAARWVPVLIVPAVALMVWEALTRREVLRRVDPDAGWGRTSYSYFDRETDNRILRATGWPPAFVRGVQGATFLAFFAMTVWSLWR